MTLTGFTKHTRKGELEMDTTGLLREPPRGPAQRMRPPSGSLSAMTLEQLQYGIRSSGHKLAGIIEGEQADRILAQSSSPTPHREDPQRRSNPPQNVTAGRRIDPSEQAKPQKAQGEANMRLPNRATFSAQEDFTVGQDVAFGAGHTRGVVTQKLGRDAAGRTIYHIVTREGRKFKVSGGNLQRL